MSIIVDHQSVWNDTIGIMKKGLAAEEEFPYKGANYWKKIQLPSYIEYFDQNKELVLSQKSKIKIHGNYSKTQPLKSLRIKANNKDNIFHFTPFQDKEKNKFSELILRNSGQDALKSHFRDAFMHNYVEKFLNIDGQNAQPVLVFINGEYYGLLNLRERYNEVFFKENYGDRDIYNVLKLWGVPILGSDKDYIKIRERINTISKTKEQPIDLMKYFNMLNWIDYFIIETYSANLDWFPNNTVFWSSNQNNKWHYLLADLDAGIGAKKEITYSHDMFNFLFHDSPNKEFPVFMNDIETRNKFIIRYMDLLNTALKPDAIIKNALKYQEKIENEIPRLLKKYTPKYRLYTDQKLLEKWKNDYLNKLYNFLQKRPFYIKKQLQEHFELDQIKKINILSQITYKFNSLDLNNNFSGEYFTGLNYKISINSKENPGFSHFQINDKEIYADMYLFELNSDINIVVINK